MNTLNLDFGIIFLLTVSIKDIMPTLKISWKKQDF